MSGGSMEYLSYRVADAQFSASTPERRAFRAHLQLIAKAMHIIEWNDSGDGADGEKEAILACLQPGAVLAQVTAEARVALAALQDALSDSQGNKP